MNELTADILIFGSGGAGMFAALHAADAAPGMEIAIVVKGLFGKSGCTRMVQGGYNAVLNPEDSLDRHFNDTIAGGAWINNQELAWALVSGAPERIRELEERCGCYFDRNSDGSIHQKPFGGQSFDRTVHRGDLTGIEIISRLADQVMARPNIRILEEMRAVDLLSARDGDGVAGALLLDIRSGGFVVARARATLIATGGGARIHRFSSPSVEKSGDGVALAFTAGVPLVDMEMLQFHPTGLLAGKSILTGSVVEEGLRGAGGKLLNANRERFMERYDPKRLERSTRDIISRAIYLEVEEGRGTANGGVLLDVSHLGREFVAKNFPGMCERARMVDRDLTSEPIEVCPTSHFHMGGAVIDVDCATEREGLFVAGEDAGGVHGANRLGGNGVADSTVFGARAGDHLAAYAPGRALPSISESEVGERVSEATAPLGRTGSENPFELRSELGDLMWDHVGVVRKEAELRTALDGLHELDERLGRVGVTGSPAYNLTWQEVLNLRSLLVVGEATARASLERTETRGSHCRSDHPERDDERWLRNVVLRRGEGGMETSTIPVQFTRLTPEVDGLSPSQTADVSVEG